jgi:PAS domain S-box-containing protein
MYFKSITSKLLAFIVGAGSVATVAVFFLIDGQIEQTLDKNKEAIYAERVDAIVGFLKMSNDHLKKSGQMGADVDDGKASALKILKTNYYRQSGLTAFPFILDGDGRTVMHPSAPDSDLSRIHELIATTMGASKNTSFSGTYQDRNTWYIYRKFNPWNWIIGFRVPLDIMCGVAPSTRNLLVIVFAGTTIFALIILALVTTQFTRPIAGLTKAAGRFAAGDLKRPIATSGKDDVGVLARDMENMRTALKDHIEELNTELGERTGAEEELHQLLNYLSNIINSMPFVLVGVGAEGIITQWNLKAQRLTNLSAADVLGRSIDEAVPQLSIDFKRVRQAIETRKELTDKRRREERGTVVFEKVTIYPLIANGVEGAVIRIDDVTEKVRMEEMMIQSEKMLSVGGLAAGMAHEINNPLAGIMQTAEVMANRLGSHLNIPANQRAAEAAGVTMEVIENYMEARGIPRMIASITESGRRVVAIVDNMLSFARKSDATVSVQVLDELVDRTLELAATDYDLKKNQDFRTITIIKEYDDDLPGVPCEAAKIQQVLLNILRNCAQAMHTAGTKEPRLIIRIYRAGEQAMACIEIEDNGPGMNEDTRRRVFEPFFTTKKASAGTGLGLSVSYFIITENHGGEMAVESSPGAGAKFIIRMPLKAKE